jgi:hypothetical protein
VKALWQHAEEILDTASCAERDAGVVVMMDRQGGVRVLDPAGWTFGALQAEFGAAMIFKVNKSPEATSVEAWAGCDHCVIERQTVKSARSLPLTPAVCHPIRLHTTPLFIGKSDAQGSAV